MSGHYISELSFKELQPLLTEDAIVVLPIGGGLQGHGAHLPLGTDSLIAEHLAESVRQRTNALTLPVLSYTFAPQRATTPGTISIASRTFIDFVKDILISYARHGVRRFVLLNYGEEAIDSLYTVATEMNNEWHVKAAVALGGIGSRKAKELLGDEPQGVAGGSVETSLVLYLLPDAVRSARIADAHNQALPADFVLDGVPGAFIPRQAQSESGIDGSPSKASREAGEAIYEAMVDDIVYFIDNFREYRLDDY